MEITKAINILVDTIGNNRKHKDFDRVTKYAKRWKQIITGEDIGELIKIFSPREDPELFKQREQLTQVITPAVCNALMNPSSKISRARPIENSIMEGDKPLEDVVKQLENYYSQQSIDFFLESIFIPHVYWDPNSFIITTFDDFDFRFQKPRPYSVLITCFQAINYEFANGDLQWLVVQSDPEKPDRFLIYTDTNVIDAKLIDQDALPVDAKFVLDGMKDGSIKQENKKLFTYKKNKDQVYSLEIFTPKTKEILAIRTGYLLDKGSENRTCISPLHPALNYLLKSIKVVSEMDISISLHVFLQKFIYVPRCKGDGIEGCNRGYTNAGFPCKICKGTMKIPMHTSSADTVELPLPEDVTELFDLSKMAHYQDLPIDILKWLDEFVDKLDKKCTKAIYGSEIFQTDTVVSTATEKLVDFESILDALFPFGRQYTKVRVQVTRLNCKFLDHANPVIKYRIPYDLKIRTYNQLLIDLRAANESGASAEVREAISDDVATLLYIDRPDEYKKLKIRDEFNPFSGKLPSEITYILSNNDCLQEQRVLWAQGPDIWTTLEKQNPKLYEMDYNKIKELLDKEVARRIEIMDAQKIVATPFGADGVAEQGNAGDSLGKLPLGLQQMALTLDRLRNSGNESLASEIEAKMKEMNDAIEVS